MDAEGPLTLTGTQFVSNTAPGGGGGVFALDTTTVVGGLFEDNHCTQTNCFGGGLFSGYALAVTDTQFLRNTAQGSGGGLAHTTNSGQLVNALFAGNAAGGAGGALYLSSPLNETILHATIAGAAPGSSGSAIAILSGTVGITNSIIASYTVGISLTAGTARESHSLFFGDGNNTLGPVTHGGGGLTANPRFVRPEVDDYHLRLGSPAIDAGENAGIAFDIDGDPRPLENGFDIGYDEANIRYLLLPLVVR